MLRCTRCGNLHGKLYMNATVVKLERGKVPQPMALGVLDKLCDRCCARMLFGVRQVPEPEPDPTRPPVGVDQWVPLPEASAPAAGDGKPVAVDQSDLSTCPDCGFQAKSAFGLKAHRRKHAGRDSG